ncbi:MAG: hypothetical protein C0631_11165 [Sedimenticola sp.]|jgi:hypothetical protein|nr:MAG: hypothetical protein C0631_11165 [Sedimenticola sp.]
MSELSLNYERVERQLASADVESSGAEVHGVLCGLLCCGRSDALSLWYRELLPDAADSDLLARECEASLRQLYNETKEAIDGPGLGFTPFLPDEEKSQKLRAAAVSEWCQGFLYGVGLAEISAQRQLSAETQEALHDFSEITRMDLDALAGEDSDEDALIEITEFLWVAAMLVHSDLVKDPTERS